MITAVRRRDSTAKVLRNISPLETREFETFLRTLTLEGILVKIVK